MNFSSMFTGPAAWIAWSVMASVPPAIVLLYFLKLKRQPVEVPSTYLWHKSIEDLHVNSIWQRLRQNLLLFLQLLLIFLAILALLRPSFSGARLVGDRFVFMIDNSASMSATDVKPTRLEHAKRRVLELIEEMKGGDVAMIVSFSNKAKIDQDWTDNKKDLRRAVELIKPTQKQTDISEALRAAAGLANTAQTAFEAGDNPFAKALPATLYIFSDGNFQPPSFSLGNLEPVYVPLGTEQPGNVAVAAFSAQRNEEILQNPNQMQAFARLENHGPQDATVVVELFQDGRSRDVKEVDIPAGQSNGVVFDLDEFESGVLRLEVQRQDDLAVDNVAWAAANAPRRARLLVVTSGNEPLLLALRTEGAQKMMDLILKEPRELETETFRQEALAGAYDLIIFDRCFPKAVKDDANTPTPMPACNTLFIGRLPKLPGWGWQPGQPWPPPLMNRPEVIDVERAHPLMQMIELGNVRIAESYPVKPPAGGTVLIESDVGGVFAIGPREGFEDAVMGFPLIDDKNEVATDWFVRQSFPVFVLNMIQYLGGSREALASGNYRPGQSAELRVDTAEDKLVIKPPSGRPLEVQRSRTNTFRYTDTEQLGVYEVIERGNKVVQRFTVNLFDSQEANLAPRRELKFQGGSIVEAQTHWEPARKDTWRWLLLLALTVLLVEWYIYNRRVYI
jgi:hypothetical protein